MALSEVPNDAVPARAIRAALIWCTLTDDTESVRVVDIEQDIVLARESRKGGQVRQVAGHAVDPVHADDPGASPVGAEQLLELIEGAVVEARQRGASGPAAQASVLDRPV